MALGESVAASAAHHASSGQKPKHGIGFDLAQPMSAFVEQDNQRDKTWSRIVVEKYLAKKKWYFPMRDKHNGPNLSQGSSMNEL